MKIYCRHEKVSDFICDTTNAETFMINLLQLNIVCEASENLVKFNQKFFDMKTRKLLPSLMWGMLTSLFKPLEPHFKVITFVKLLLSPTDNTLSLSAIIAFTVNFRLSTPPT